VLAARIAIDLGPVVVDATGEIFGDVPNVAARAQALAEPGAVVVTARVQRQVARMRRVLHSIAMGGSNGATGVVPRLGCLGLLLTKNRAGGFAKGNAGPFPENTVLTAIESGLAWTGCRPRTIMNPSSTLLSTAPVAAASAPEATAGRRQGDGTLASLVQS
jgi:hypothetical protein